MDWESAHYTRVSDTHGYYDIPLSDGSSLRMEVNATFVNMEAGGVPTDDGLGTANDNLALSNFDIGGTGQSGLVLHQNDLNHQGQGGYQDVTFTFDRAIATIDFQVTDLDYYADETAVDFWDAVGFSTNLTTTPSANLDEIQVADGRLWYRSTYAETIPNESGANNVAAHGEDLTQFTVTYENWAETSNHQDRDQRVFLPDFAITVPPVGC
ncbi:hypothetical protein [Kytococcus sp. Marseille-QA3725]